MLWSYKISVQFSLLAAMLVKHCEVPFVPTLLRSLCVHFDVTLTVQTAVRHVSAVLSNRSKEPLGTVEECNIMRMQCNINTVLKPV